MLRQRETSARLCRCCTECSQRAQRSALPPPSSHSRTSQKPHKHLAKSQRFESVLGALKIDLAKQVSGTSAVRFGKESKHRLLRTDWTDKFIVGGELVLCHFCCLKVYVMGYVSRCATECCVASRSVLLLNLKLARGATAETKLSYIVRQLVFVQHQPPKT